MKKTAEADPVITVPAYFNNSRRQATKGAGTITSLELSTNLLLPPYPLHTADYATYVQILTSFFDTPSPETPFSFQIALAGKKLGNRRRAVVWTQPSVAAGAIR
jgi:cysteine protease ATG4